MKGLHDHKALLMLAIFSTVFVGLLYLYIQYRIGITVNDIADMRQKSAEVKFEDSKENELAKLYAESKEKWAELPSFFVPSDGVVKFIEAVEGIGDKTGSTVTISSIDADRLDSATTSNMGTLRIRVTAEGSWASVMKTLKLAEVLPYHAEIDALHMSVTADNSGKDAKKIWRMAFDATVDELRSQK